MLSQVEAKKSLIQAFLNELITDRAFEAFVDFKDEETGCLDAPFIMRSDAASLLDLKETLKSKKNPNFEEFFGKIRSVFEGVSDYILFNDPLQRICERGVWKVN